MRVPAHEHEREVRRWFGGGDSTKVAASLQQRPVRKWSIWGPLAKGPRIEVDAKRGTMPASSDSGGSMARSHCVEQLRP